MPLGSRLVVVGAGAFGREVICWLEQSRGEIGGGTRFGFIDRGPEVIDTSRYPLEFMGTIDDFVPQPGDELVMGIGEPQGKRRVAELLSTRGGRFATLVHPSAVLARTAAIGEGAVICPHAMVSADGKVGRLVAVNTMSSVGHDVVVGDYSTLSSHVDLTGGVAVGEECFFGSGARILPKVRIGTGARVGAGAVVMRNVKAGTTVYAAPARRL